MANRLAEQREPIEMYCALHKKSNLNLEPHEWIILQEFTKVLRYFDDATNELCKANAPISAQLPAAKIIYENIQTNTIEFISIVESLKKLIEKRFFDLENNRY